MKMTFAAAIALLFVSPAFAQDAAKPAAGPAPTKAEVQKLVDTIAADPAKLKSYCDLEKLGAELIDANEKKNEAKVVELSKKQEELAKSIGSDFMDISIRLDQLAPADATAAGAPLDDLDKKCS